MIPQKLQVRGVNFCLIAKGEKKPFEKDWQIKKLEFDETQLLNHINSNGNYGVRGGGDAKLIIVDFDNEKVESEVMPKLPETFKVRTGSGRLHLYFFSDKCDSFKIFDDEMNTLADVQGEGKQVVAPGSIHPNGNKYQVIDDRDIAFISYSELKAILMAYDKKPRKEKNNESKVYIGIKDETNFADVVRVCVSLESVLRYFGVDTSKNPTNCPFHSSKGGKCLGWNNETWHCFHCEESGNLFSMVMKYNKCDFKEALSFIADKFGLQKEYDNCRRSYIEKQRQSERNEKSDIKMKFLEFIKDDKIGSATELLVDYIKGRNHLFTSKNDQKSEMWIYKEGIYVPQGKCEIKEILRDILGSWYNAYYYNQVINKLEADTFIDIDQFFSSQSAEEIPVKNGILNIKTRELKPFTPDKVFFNKLPVEYIPEKDCPQVDEFLRGVLAKEEDKNVFYEFGGFCLLKDYKFEKALMLVGDGRNGKDKSLELIKRVIGIENCCAVPLSSLVPESFIISEFFGKMANIAGDINNNDLKDTSCFKGLTGRSIQTAPRKFLNPITFVNYAKFIFACNQLPIVYDNSKGFWDRWILLEYPYTFVTKEELQANKDNPFMKLRDESIIEKISTPDQLSGLLNRFLDGLDRLLKNKTFSSTRGSEEIKNLWIRRSNSVMAFCFDMIEDSYDSYISKMQFRKRYIEYCKEHKIPQKSDYVIKKTLEELFGGIEENKDTGLKWEKVWGGIRWKI